MYRPYADTDHGYMVRLTVKKNKTEQVELIPYRLTPEIKVAAITGDDENKYAAFLRKLSLQISDDDEFMRQWEMNVAMRWEQDYQNILRNLSTRYRADDDSAVFKQFA